MTADIPRLSPAATADDPRVEQILAALERFGTGEWAGGLASSGEGDALDQIIDGLNALARAQAARQAAVEQQQQSILAVLNSMLAFDFSKRAPVGGGGTALDALAGGINTISDTLAVSAVSRAYVDNILDSMTDPLLVLDADLVIQRANHAAAQLFGRASEHWCGQALAQLLDDPVAVEQLGLVASQLRPLRYLETSGRVRDGQTVPLGLSASPMSDGGAIEIVCVVRDLTERKQAEEALRQNMVQAEIIRAQAAAIAELSTPLMPINDQILVMPLVGTVDARRAEQVVETLLHGVTAKRAEFVIIDITGVPVVDTQVAQVLIGAGQAVRMLGARLLLTGIRPEVAQTLTSLGVDLSQVITRSTLQSGIALVLERKKK
ncbi:MAG TPA: STAS domain-containing protein [Roseiflexaceae bacterium]|nr:STAS domain-containing protein [Roseiflexaceae bacterium]